MALKTKQFKNRKLKPKAVRKTRSEQYIVNFKYLGDEPDANKLTTVTDQAAAFNWYNSMCSKEEARDYISDYLVVHNPEMTKKVSRIPDNWIPLTAAWVCRMSTRSGKKVDDRIMIMITDAMNHIKEEQLLDKPKVDKPSIQDRIRERGYDIVGDIEEMIDKGDEFSLYGWLKKNEIPAMYAVKIADYYSPILDEMTEAYAGKIDGYENWTKSQLKARVALYSQIISDAEKYGDVTKKTRAPRKPRLISTEKLLKNFKYQKESAEYKIASINPEKIIGAQELWVFNTKYKVLTVFRAIDRGGLKINRSSITNYSEENSCSRSTGRKTEEVLKKISDGGKITLRKLMDELKSERGLQHRINENTVIMKVTLTN
jgi:hypothetical protein